MAQATLINSAGQKQVVTAGSQQAQQLFGQGYQLMGASGKYVPAAQAPSASPTAAKPTPAPVSAAPVQNTVTPARPPQTPSSAGFSAPSGTTQVQNTTQNVAPPVYTAGQAPPASALKAAGMASTQQYAAANNPNAANQAARNAYDASNGNIDAAQRVNEWNTGLNTQSYSQSAPNRPPVIVAPKADPLGLNSGGLRVDALGSGTASLNGAQALQPTFNPQTTMNAAGLRVDHTGSSAIPFKPGLSQTQMDSIIALVNRGTPFNAEDTRNWNYATNNAPIPNSAMRPPTAPPPTPAQSGDLLNSDFQVFGQSNSSGAADPNDPLGLKSGGLNIDQNGYPIGGIMRPPTSGSNFATGGSSNVTLPNEMGGFTPTPPSNTLSTPPYLPDPYPNRNGEFQKIIEALTKAMTPSAEEQGLISQQNAQSDSTAAALTDLIGKHQMSQSLLSGYSNDIQNQGNDVQNTLTRKLSALQAQRAAASDIAKTQLGLQEYLQTGDVAKYNAMQEQKKPVEVNNNLVRFNPQTGKYETVYKGQPDMQVVADPINGGIFRVSKQGSEGQVNTGGGSFTPSPTPTGGFSFGNDTIGLLAAQVQQDPSRLASLPAPQQTAVLSRMAQSGAPIPGAQNKPLGDAAAKVAGFVTTLRTGLPQLEARLQQDYQGTVLGILTGTNRQDSALVSNLADAFGRLRSGGAVNKDEEARFRGLLVSAMDLYSGSPETAKASIDRLAAEAEATYAAMSGQAGQQQGLTPETISQKYGRSLREIQETLQGFNPVTKQHWTLQDIDSYLQSHPKANAPSTNGVVGAALRLDVGSPQQLVQATQRIARAIGQFESGGNYAAVGNPTSSGDRAFGKYQIMGSNIPSWSKQILGYSITPQQFLANPQLQDQIALGKMAGMVQTYGNVDDVASVWFSGKPVHQNGAQDVNGTSVPEYVAAVRSIFSKLA